MTSPHSPILQKLIGLTGAEYRGGNYHMPCPECGKVPKGKKGYGHFSFYVKGAKSGAKCFVCGFSCSLARLHEIVSGTKYQENGLSPVLSHPTQPEPGLRGWQKQPDKYLAKFCAAPDRVSAWQRYRPLTLATIAAYDLGVGVLPSSQCKHKRLIIPLKEAGKIVGFRGRAIDCDCDKWLCSAGSKTLLFGADKLYQGCTVVVIEAPADVIFGSQMEPGYVIVAGTSGVGTWLDEWTALLYRYASQVLIWFDNDLAGDPNQETMERCLAEWKAEHPKGKPPRPFGPVLQARLRKAGLLAVRNSWPHGTPVKADFGWKLMQIGA